MENNYSVPARQNLLLLSLEPLDPDDDDPLALVFDEAGELKQRYLHGPAPDVDDPNEEECEDDCEKYRDFAHGSSLESINNIVANGISNEAIRNRTRGGQVNRPGFYTIELTQQDGNTVNEKLSLAYEFGLRHSSQPAILIMQLYNDVYRELKATNQVLKRPVAGEEKFTETLFKPESFSTLNRETKFIDILRP